MNACCLNKSDINKGRINVFSSSVLSVLGKQPVVLCKVQCPAWETKRIH